MDITTPAVTARPAAMRSAILTASVTSSALAAAGSAAMTGMTASPARLAPRATALFTPEPVLTWSGSVDGHHGRGQWGDVGDEPDAEDKGSGQDIGGPRGFGVDPGEKQHPCAGEDRSGGELEAGTDSLGKTTGSGGEEEHEGGGRQEGEAGLEGGPAGGDLELVGDEEEGQSDPGVEEKGSEVHNGERPVAKELGRHQRVGRPSDVRDEPGHGQDCNAQRSPPRRHRPSPAHRLR